MSTSAHTYQARPPGPVSTAVCSTCTLSELFSHHLYNLNIAPSCACVSIVTLVRTVGVWVPEEGVYHLHRVSHYVGLFVKQNAHMCTHVCTCVWRMLPPRLSLQTPHTASAYWRLSPAPTQPAPPPFPSLFAKTPAQWGLACGCVFACLLFCPLFCDSSTLPATSSSTAALLWGYQGQAREGLPGEKGC